MGNALECTAAASPMNWTQATSVLHNPLLTTPDGRWECAGQTQFNWLDQGAQSTSSTCVFPFMYNVVDGPNRVYSGCVSSDTATPPGLGASGGAHDTPFFWCSTKETLFDSEDSSNVAMCGCMPVEGGGGGGGGGGEGSEEGEEGENKDYGWIIGIAFSILSSVCTTVGTLIQKTAHMINDKLPREKRAREVGGILLSPRWFTAFFLMVLFPLPFDFVALAMAAQSLLVVFAGLTIVLNMFFARFIGERPDRIEIIATCVIMVGLVLTTTSGQKEDTNFNACELLERYSDGDFLAGTLTLGALIAVCLVCIHFVTPTPWISRLKPCMYAFCAGGFGGLGNIIFKATGELAEAGLASDGRGSSAWQTVHPYYHIVLIITFATLQIMHINQGLRRYNAVLFVPLYNCMYIILSGSMGAMTYREFDNYTLTQWVLFPLGVSITLGGIMIMTLKDPELTDEHKIAPTPGQSAAVKAPAAAAALAPVE